ncbi:helix-turn-helix domain-containing protein [Desulfovibrio sp. SGI.169]|uniref:helix-turn-helix domain-containing protein n=1 Tax=Desulfovibrio sp. SGI.169 TaxID=3420561 RepID=UPI003D08B4DA
MEEVMEYLRIGRNAALKLFQSGAIGGRKAGREWRTTRGAIDEWLAGGGKADDETE